ncbi:MAG: heavy metal translocating P-type ATPase [Chitinispirillaceae bacterium]
MITKYHVKNLDCVDCALKIEEHLRRVEGIRSADVNFASLTLTVDTDTPDRIRGEVREVEPEVELVPLSSATVDEFAEDHKEFHVRRTVAVMVIAGVMFLGVLVIDNFFRERPYVNMVQYVLAAVAYFLAGWNVLRGAFRTIRRGVFFDENVLMTIATMGAVAIDALSEAVGVMIFFKVGEFFQNLAVHRSRNSIRTLLAVRPHVAHVQKEGALVDLSPDEVKAGEVVKVRPGEKIPLDGEVVSGSSHVDASALTGEPKPYTAQKGKNVLAGEINVSSVLTVRVTRPFSQSSIVRLLEQVENASARKARTEKFISRIAYYYTPAVVGAAALLALIPPLFIPGQTFSEWIYRALVLLVISCPCALVISIPLGFFGGIGGASKRGILVKGAHFLERLALLKTVVFDKTGTLTKGVFVVNRLEPVPDVSCEDLLQKAAAAEFYSDHPVAVSIKSKADQEGIGVNHDELGEHHNIAGMGVEVNFRGHKVLAGNEKLMGREGIEIPELHKGAVVYVSEDRRYLGYLVVGDEIKEDSAQAVKELKEAGVEQLWMLTGDNKDSAETVAEKLGIDHFRASLLPEQKVEYLESIMQDRREGQLAFVGDGINDAPVLARSDVGIAMGTLGADAAIETADVVIMGDSPLKVAEAMRTARTTRSIVWQNIVLALGIKLLFVSLGAMGLASMWEAVFADMGTAVLAVLNSGRALRG